MDIVRRSIVVAAAGAALLSVGGPALAHTHQICTPGAGDPIIGEEPFHGSLPGNAEASNFADNPNYGSRGFHPIHESLHMGPSGDERHVTVVVVGTATCP